MAKGEYSKYSECSEYFEYSDNTPPQILSKGSSSEEVKGAFRAATLSMARFRSSLQLFTLEKPLEIVKPQFFLCARLNRTGAQLMQKHKAGAATDVTG